MKNDYFGMVAWTDDDIELVLKERNIKPTEELVKRVRQNCEANHRLIDSMIEAGYYVIDSAVEDAVNLANIRGITYEPEH